MCETKEINEKLKVEKTGFAIKDSLDTIRENKKYHFTMKSSGIKLSTIYSIRAGKLRPLFSSYFRSKANTTRRTISPVLRNRTLR